MHALRRASSPLAREPMRITITQLRQDGGAAVAWRLSNIWYDVRRDLGCARGFIHSASLGPGTHGSYAVRPRRPTSFSNAASARSSSARRTRRGSALFNDAECGVVRVSNSRGTRRRRVGVVALMFADVTHGGGDAFDVRG